MIFKKPSGEEEERKKMKTNCFKSRLNATSALGDSKLKILMKWGQDATHIIVIIDIYKKLGVDDYLGS